MIFVDTNFFLRFLLEDNPEQRKQAQELFEEAATGKKELFTSLIVFFEIFWVLSSFYKKNKGDLANTLRGVLSLGFIQLSDRDLLVKAVDLFEKKNLNLGDCYNLTFAKDKKAQEFATFDQKLKKQF